MTKMMELAREKQAAERKTLKETLETYGLPSLLLLTLTFQEVPGGRQLLPDACFSAVTPKR